MPRPVSAKVMRSRSPELLSSVAREVPKYLLQLAFISFGVEWLVGQFLDDALVRGDLRTVPHQRERLVYQLSYVHTRLDERPWPGVTEKIRDDAIQAIRLAEDNLHQFCLRRIAVHLRTQHLNRAAHGSEWIANLMGNRRSHATDRSETVLAARGLFQTADVSQILESDHHSGRFARLGR